MRYRIAASDGSTTTSLVVDVDSGVTVAELCTQLRSTVGGEWNDGLYVGGRHYPPTDDAGTLPLSDGVAISPIAMDGAPPSGLALELQGIAGELSGVHHRLTPGSYWVAPDGQIPVPTTVGVRLTVETAGTLFVDPPGSEVVVVNGVALDGPAVLSIGDTLQVGGTVWRLARPRADEGAHQRIIFNRPPRILNHAPSRHLEPAVRTPDPAKRSAMRWTSTVAPLLMGVAMYAMFQRLIFLAFMLLSPVMAGFNWMDDKFRIKKERKRNDADFAIALGNFTASVTMWRLEMQHHLAAKHRDMSAVVQTALQVRTALWERRPHHSDYLVLIAGYGTQNIPLPIKASREGLDESVIAELDGASRFDGIAVEISLRESGVVGLWGGREATLGLARSLIVQAAVHHGPGDVQLAVMTAPRSATDWSWMAWLPHVEGPTGSRLLGMDPGDVELIASEIGRSSRHTIVVVDIASSEQVATLVSQLRAAEDVSVIVLAEHAERLPSTADPVLAVESGSRISVSYPSKGQVTAGIGPALVPAGVAEDVARSLARVVDPERTNTDGDLPTTVNLLDLLHLPDPTPGQIMQRWSESGTAVTTPIGATVSGPLTIDLVHDGPHGLLAGTTGAGKSELLRSLVAGLAASTDPDHLNFVLIDYKGGSAFDMCSELPHVVGVVTDLDDHLARRALTCLEAELHHREQVLRDAGAADLPAYQALGVNAPLPRLFIVMDEFAAMARELPEFMEALVDIGARGRSLGVHMLLATQRPAGVVKDNIRANTNLRLSLRVQDTADSRDVIDDTIAAAIPRSAPGRGYARLGPTELVGFQTALVTGVAGTRTPLAAVRPLPFGTDVPAPHRAATPEGAPTDLERLVTAICGAFAASDFTDPRTPWPPELTADPSLRECARGADSTAVPIGLVDDPRSQSQSPYVWSLRDSHLLVYGLSGTGPEQVIETTAHAVAATVTDALSYVIAAGTASFEALANLPNVSGVADIADRERCTRVLRTIDAELSARRTGNASRRPIVLLIDDIGSLRAEFSDHRDAPYLEILSRIVSQGSALDVHLVATAYQAQALPMKLASLIPQKLVMELAERAEFVSHGLRPTEIPTLRYARGVETRTKRTVQIATALDLAPLHPTIETPPIALLPRTVSASDIGHAADLSERPWRIPFGIGDSDLQPATLQLDETDHLLISGSARTGKSTTLARLAETLARHAPETQLVAVLPKRSPLAELDLFKYVVTDMSQLDGLSAALVSSATPVAVFIDDAEMVEGKAMDSVLTARNPNVHVFAAGRIEDLLRMHGHWTARVRRGRLGALLRPDEAAGDLFSIRLPRTTAVFPEGRGYLVDPSGVQIVQFAQ